MVDDDDKKYPIVVGRLGGSGKYSFQERHSRRTSVMVTYMPDDDFKVRIRFRDDGEEVYPGKWIVTSEAAQLLWAALNGMAEDLHWTDEIESEYFAKKND